MWRWMYDGNQGVINDLLVRVGALRHYFPFLADSATALPAIMVALMWQGFPFFCIMILAGLQAIPESLLEAAEVDGAAPFRRFFSITLPAARAGVCSPRCCCASSGSPTPSTSSSS